MRNVACGVVEQFGFELVDVEYVKGKGSDSELIIYIDKEGGASLDDCETVSRALDDPIDKRAVYALRIISGNRPRAQNRARFSKRAREKS